MVLRLNRMAGQKSSRLSMTRGRVKNHATRRKMPGSMRQRKPSIVSTPVTKLARMRWRSECAEAGEGGFDAHRLAAYLLEEVQIQPAHERTAQEDAQDRSVEM